MLLRSMICRETQRPAQVLSVKGSFMHQATAVVLALLLGFPAPAADPEVILTDWSGMPHQLAQVRHGTADFGSFRSVQVRKSLVYLECVSGNRCSADFPSWQTVLLMA